MDIKGRLKSYGTWLILFVTALVFLWLSVTGRLGIATSIAFLPDNVAIINQ